MLVQLEKYGDAIKAYEASLQNSPNRFNSLYGAGHAAEGAGDLKKARLYYTQLMHLTANDGADRPRFKLAKTFLAKK